MLNTTQHERGRAYLAGGIGEDIVPAALNADGHVLQAADADLAHAAALTLQQAQDGAVHRARACVQVAVHVPVDQEDLRMLCYQVPPQPRPHLRSGPRVSEIPVQHIIQEQ